MRPQDISSDVIAVRVPARVRFRSPLAYRPRSLFVLASALSFFTLWLIPRVASCQSAEAQIAQHFRAGHEALRQGEFPRATEEFRTVLALDPSLLEAEVNLGLAYHSLSDYGLAVRHLTKALRGRPDLLAANVVVGMDYLKLGSPQQAFPFLQRALKLDPTNQEARRALASYYLGQQNFPAAAHEFKHLAELNLDKSETWFTLGHEYLDLSARLAYRGAHFYPNSAWGHRFLGDLLYERNRWDEAAQEYRKALIIEPQQPGLHTCLSQAYLHLGKLEEAQADFRRELEVGSANERAWLGLGEVALRQEHTTSAITSVAKAWEASPELVALQKEFPTVELTAEDAQNAVLTLQAVSESPAKHFLLAALYPITGESTRADEQWKALQDDLLAWQKARTNPEQDPCRSRHYSACVHMLQTQKVLTDSRCLLLGEAQFVLRQYESAAEVLGKVQGVTKANAEASYWLSRTYQALGTESYAQLEESFPDSWRTHQLRAEGYELRQDLDNAIKELLLAIQIRPDSAELHEVLGNVYIKKHSDADAEKELQSALAIDSSRAGALYLLGRLYAQSGENEKAIPNLQKALRLQPGLSEASSLLGTTYVRLGQFKDAIPYLEKAAQFDHYGNVHYQLYVAYRKLGQTQLAQNAMARSQNLRRSSLEHDQALIMGSPESDSERR